MIQRRNLILAGLAVVIVILGNIKVFFGKSFVYVLALTVLMSIFLIKKKYFLLALCYFGSLILIHLLRNETSGVNYSLERIKSWMPLIFTNKTVFVNVFGNIVIYIPMGFVLGKYYNVIKTIAFANIFVIGIEIIQLVFHLGVFDVLDVILNLMGIVLGFTFRRVWSWYLWKKRIMNK